MQGKIIKGIAGFYYVHVADKGIYECKAKGIFRNQNIKPMVGDNVLIDIIDAKEMEGNITKILPRSNALIRPAVSNVDQSLVIFAIASPMPNLNLLDRFLVTMEQQDVETIICFNKTDVAGQEEIDKLRAIYEPCGYQLLFTSVQQQAGLDDILNLLEGRTTVMAGPSGVGKSTLMNFLQPDAGMETGAISQKIQRGRHTTRHSEIINVHGATYVIDTPGFTSLQLTNLEKEDLKDYFIEFEPYEGQCRFNGCVHVHEPNCAVKQALTEGKISQTRYKNYTDLFNELKEQRRY